jgi:arylsulfatase A-like enzyme
VKRVKAVPILPLLGLLVACGGTPAAEQAVDYRCGDCNVILISIDTLRADHLGCYGYPRPTSPAVDRFSKQSVLFRTAIAHAPSTEPSHASMFTSLLPAHHGGLRAKHQPISEDVTMMAEILHEAGLRTISYNGGGQVAASYGFDRGFELYESSADPFANKVGDAIRWLDEHAEERFFMFLHTYEVHAPYSPMPRFMDMFDADYQGELEDSISPGLLIDVNEGKVILDEQDQQHIVNAYDAEIRSMDSAFGHLVGYLEQRGLLDKTLVVFTSDHGEEFGEHAQMGRHSHTLYDELLHVPLIVRMPGGNFSSTVVERQVRGIDILPTVLDVLGLESPGPHDGSSLTGLMTGRDEQPRVAVSQIDTADVLPPSSIRTETQKLITAPRALVEGAPYRWYEDKVELVSVTHALSVPVESFHHERRVRASVDGKVVKEGLIHPWKHPFDVQFRTPEERVVTIESLEPCTRPAEVGVELEAPCVSFRIFNPFEYFALDTDPAEQDNLFDDTVQQETVARLKQQLDEILASRPSPGEKKIELDEKTRERLRALGYVD